MWKATRLRNGINAFKSGQGTPVVLLGGWPETVEAFTELFPLISRKYKTLAIDLPGLGNSDPSEDGYDTETISEVLNEAVESSIKEPYHLVGHDIGSWVAYPWAAKFPQKLRSLTLMDAGIPGLTPPMSFPLPAELNSKLWQFSFNALPDLPEILTRGRERELFDWFFDQKLVRPERISRESRDRYVEAYARPGAMSRGFAYYRAASQSALQNREFSRTKLHMPILAVGGRDGVADMLQRSVAKVGDDVRGKIIEDCGHYVMEEQPLEVADALLSFFEEIDGALQK